MCKEDNKDFVDNPTVYVNIAICIINQAVRDIGKDGYWKKDAEVFFNSEWYEVLQGMIDLYKNPEGNTI